MAEKKNFFEKKQNPKNDKPNYGMDASKDTPEAKKKRKQAIAIRIRKEEAKKKGVK